MCRAGAVELSSTADKINFEYPNKVKFVGIGVDEIDFDDFKNQGFFKHDLFINKNKTIYKALGYQKPGCLSCFGVCNKNFLASVNKTNEKFKDDKKVKGVTWTGKADAFQMGGSLLITSNGDVVFQYVDSFYGDHAKETEILEAVNNFFNKDLKA